MIRDLICVYPLFRVLPVEESFDWKMLIYVHFLDLPNFTIQKGVSMSTSLLYLYERREKAESNRPSFLLHISFDKRHLSELSSSADSYSLIRSKSDTACRIRSWSGQLVWQFVTHPSQSSWAPSVE